MTRSASWSPYVGSSAVILAVSLFVVAGVLIYLAIQLSHPISVKRPGASLGVVIIVAWVLAVITFLVAVTVYVRTLQQQIGPITGPANPITPVTMSAGLVAFLAILALARQSGFWVAIGSAIVGTIAAPLIFELPFDLIVMWRTYPPHPAVLFTLLYFLPLFLIEILSFAMLMLSPLMKLSRYTLYLLAGMFLVFAVWAMFGFAYPSAPLPTALNMISKILAFASAVSLLLPEGGVARMTGIVQADDKTPNHAPDSSGLV